MLGEVVLRFVAAAASVMARGRCVLSRGSCQSRSRRGVRVGRTQHDWSCPPTDHARAAVPEERFIPASVQPSEPLRNATPKAGPTCSLTLDHLIHALHDGRLYSLQLIPAISDHASGAEGSEVLEHCQNEGPLAPQY